MPRFEAYRMDMDTPGVHPSDHISTHPIASTTHQQQQFPTVSTTHPQQQFPNAAFAGLNSPAPSDPTDPTKPPTNPPTNPAPHRADDPQFDIFDWYPKYQSCQRYFLDHAQHSAPVQAVAAFLNIHLPFQRHPNATASFASRSLSSSSSSTHPHPHPHPPPHPPPGGASSSSSPYPRRSHTHPPPPPRTSPSPPSPPGAAVSLIPYLRRLVVTGLDFPGILHGFFGDDWTSGVGPLHEQERRNYLFAAKSGGWASVKKDYDMLPLETVPFLRPLQAPVDREILAAEKSWSEWLAMEDWMVGSRAPEEMMEPGAGAGGRGRGR